MPKKILLIILLFLASGFFVKSVIAAEGHSITGLKITTNPKSPQINKIINNLIATYTLESQTGIDPNRIKIFVDKTQIKTNESDFTIKKNINSKTVRMEYKPGVDLVFKKNENKFRVEYWLTRTNGVNPLASQETIIKCSGNSQDGSGEDIIQITRLLYLEIEDINSQNNEEVSKTARKFRITVEHDENYLSFVDKKFFDPGLDLILKNLKIIASSEKQKINVTKNFKFNLEENSEESSSKEGYLITKYISDSIIIEDPMDLIFNIDLSKYFKKNNIVIPNNIITKANSKISIKPIQIDLEDINLVQENINFITTKKTRDKYFFQSQGLNLTAKFTSENHTVNKIEKILFKTTNQSGKTVNSRIQFQKKYILPIKPLNSNTPNIEPSEGNTYDIELPYYIIFNSKKTNFNGSKNPLKNSQLKKTLYIPISIKATSSENLKMELKGILIKDYSMEFEI